MQCPADIAAVMYEILRFALIRIRGFGFGGDGRRCAHEADHVHNLPDLIRSYSPERLLYYWDLERPLFINKVEECRVFEDCWQQLQPLVERERAHCSIPTSLAEVHRSATRR